MRTITRTLVHLITVCFLPSYCFAELGRLECTPKFSHFCKNIHIGCSGKSNIVAPKFSVDIRRANTSVVFEHKAVAKANMVESAGEKILIFQNSRDWIRIEKDGRYSYRTYRGALTLMSLGQCVFG